MTAFHTFPKLIRADTVAPMRFTKSAIAVLVALIGLFITMRFWNLTTYSLWGGETFLLDGVRLGWRDMLAYIIDDVVHPPLFYILLKVWILVGGDSLLWLKLLPTLVSVATIIPFLLLCRELNLRPVEINLAFVMIAVNGFLIHYAQELRMYSLLMFLGVCSCWLFVRFFNAESAKRHFLPLLMINLMLVYTHYFGWLVVGLQFLFILFWGRQKLALFSSAVFGVVLLFSPWVYFVIDALIQKGGLASNVDWIPSPNLSSLVHFYANLNGVFGFRGGRVFSLPLFGFAIAWWCWQVVQTSHRSDRPPQLLFWWLFLFSVASVAGVYVGSQLLHYSAWVDRYLIFTAVPYILMVAVAAHRLSMAWLRQIVISAIALWSVVAGVQDLRTNRIAWETPQIGSRVTWEPLVEELVRSEPSTRKDVKIYVLPIRLNGYLTGAWAIKTSVKHFLNNLGDKRFDLVYGRHVNALLSEAKEKHFWVAAIETEKTEHHRLQRLFSNNGYLVGKTLWAGEQDKKILFLPVWRR